MRISHKIVVLVLVGICYVLLFYKIHIWGSGISRMLPQRYYELMLNISFDGHDEDVQLSVALPTITSRQTVREEFFGSPEFAFHIRRDGSNRWGIWEKSGAHGRYVIVY